MNTREDYQATQKMHRSISLPYIHRRYLDSNHRRKGQTRAEYANGSNRHHIRFPEVFHGVLLFGRLNELGECSACFIRPLNLLVRAGDRSSGQGALDRTRRRQFKKRLGRFEMDRAAGARWFLSSPYLSRIS
ncbi:hypothetical protein FIBSPDRAFT_122077 [Athelia psychrophila]|uniref:Uncharacterized protein n=1 Tax=Athelia psychrophila TaxID=1759441 RepID=A0A167SQ01_9AGAM|nr:hypothetical protein FIBSPDRAFT_122077 [Fibularhizoctonia sp. CBS 109695]